MSDEMFSEMRRTEEERGEFNPIFMMADSGARGSKGAGSPALQRCLVDKIQEVYRSQSVAINDKHIETICRQMLRSVRVTRVGDTDFLVEPALSEAEGSRSIASASWKRTRRS